MNLIFFLVVFLFRQLYIDHFLFLSDEGPMHETLDYTIRIGSTPTFLYFQQYLAFTLVVNRWNLRLCVGNSSVDKIYIIRPKPGPVAKNATPRPSGWESNPRPLDY